MKLKYAGIDEREYPCHCPPSRSRVTFTSLSNQVPTEILQHMLIVHYRYVAAMPGVIVSSLKKVGVSNPVILLGILCYS